MPQISPEVVFFAGLISTIVCFVVATNILDNLKILRRATRNAELSSEQHAQFRASAKRARILVIIGSISLIITLGALASS